MPCDSRIVGGIAGPFEYDVDEFWTMAYAAGVGDANPRYFDSLRLRRVIAHPVFPVCLATRARWRMEPMFIEAGLKPEESIRSVHVTQDMILHRPIIPPERVRVTAMISAMEPRRSGTYLLTSYEIADADGAPIATIHWGRLWRGVGMTGPERRMPGIPPPPVIESGSSERAEIGIHIPPQAAIVYTACSRADNPVNFHTDTAAANRSGLARPILMGVATLAMAISRIMEWQGRDNPNDIARIHARFGAMVFMPSDVLLRAARAGRNSAIAFEALNAEGAAAIRDGAIVWRAES